ncbi:hypothetical protein [Streptomyces gardneri]|uniref:hypothetical protein n=1 Tax=Streptomyces gardneri TaxID=66892 RepID=UPI0033FE9A64
MSPWFVKIRFSTGRSCPRARRTKRHIPTARTAIRTSQAVKELVSTLLTLTALLLAFVLVTANGAHSKAEAAAGGEARAA